MNPLESYITFILESRCDESPLGALDIHPIRHIIEIADSALYRSEIDAKGTTRWYRCCELHRGGDKPAIIRKDGTREWWWYDELHRGGDRPAITYENGSFEWWQ